MARPEVDYSNPDYDRCIVCNWGAGAHGTSTVHDHCTKSATKMSDMTMPPKEVFMHLLSVEEFTVRGRFIGLAKVRPTMNSFLRKVNIVNPQDHYEIGDVILTKGNLRITIIDEKLYETYLLVV